MSQLVVQLSYSYDACRVDAPPDYEDLYKPPNAGKDGSGYSSFGVSVDADKNTSDKPTNK